MRKKICLSFVFMLGLFGALPNLLADVEPQVESTDGASGSVSKEAGEIKMISFSDEDKEDRLGRKAIRGRDPYLYQESSELKDLREFEQMLSAAEQSGQGDAQESSGDRALVQKMIQAHPHAKDYFRFEDRVVKYVHFYHTDRRGHNILASWLKRQGRYRELIQNVLKKHRLPAFLLYVAMIESGYDPHDSSNKGAVGLWQFMPEGARIYGLRVDFWVDERKDPVRATEAVARYFEDLHERFGSWHLALAAFNAGYGAVTKSMQKYNTNDYWKLSQYEDGLPLETTLYVPKAIATAAVGENKDLFGYKDVKPDAALVFDTVPVRQSMSLSQVASVLGIDEEILTKLNPHLRRKRVPPLTKGEKWELYVPKTEEDKSVLARRLEKEAADDDVKPYVVPFGKRPEDIATDLGISRHTLWQLNGIEDRADVRAGVTLLVPARAKLRQVDSDSEELLLVAVPDKHFAVKGRKQLFYRVIYGDTISGIAKYFQVKQQELTKWNHLDLDATLATNMVLSIWVPTAFDPGRAVLVDPKKVLLVTAGSQEFLDAVETIKGRKRVNHVCQEGDTLDSIAKQYQLSVASVERINQIGRTTKLEPGQVVVVYQPLAKSEQKVAMADLISQRDQMQTAGVAQDSVDGPSLVPPSLVTVQKSVELATLGSMITPFVPMVSLHPLLATIP